MTPKISELIGREPRYPTPWRVAEKCGDQVVVVCSAAHYVAYCPSNEIAELIVQLANTAGEAVDADHG